MRPSPLAAAVLVSLSALPGLAPAQTLQYGFSTSVSWISASRPASFAGVAVGDAVSGTLQFDLAASKAAANPLGGVFATGTYYPLASASMSLTIDGMVLDSWNGTLAVLVWNNEPTVNATPNDGLLALNVASPGALQFRFGNLIYPVSNLASDALPGTTIGGFSVMSLSLAGQPDFLGTAAFSPIGVTVVPEPASLALWLAGLGTLAAGAAHRRRRYSTSLA